MPYLMAGFPTREGAAAIGRAYVQEGADLVELGLPFSDPLADGPVIHAAGTTALANGTTLGDALSLCEDLAGDLPVVVMGYVNLVLARGAQAFARALADAGGQRSDRSRSSAGGVRRGPRGLRRGGAGAGAPRRPDEPAPAPGGHRPARARLRLRGVRGRHHRGAGQPGRPCRASPGAREGLQPGPGRAGLWHLHPRPRRRRGGRRPPTASSWPAAFCARPPTRPTPARPSRPLVRGFRAALG